MPYIKYEDKEKFFLPDQSRMIETGEVFYDDIKNPGELNYILTVICKKYFENNGGRYQQINDIIGALEGCKLEFYRRLAGPYEDTKIKENGDVY